MSSVTRSGWAWWQWPNLVGLDAPLVALVWQELLARAGGVTLLASGRTTLFLAVWAVYLADRLLDTRRPQTSDEPARHRFARAHLAGLTALLAVVTGAGLISAATLRPSVRADGILLTCAVLLYLAAVHALRLRRMPKELLVAVLFTAGTALAPWARSQPSVPLVLATASLFVLCWLNLVGIEASESASADPSTVWGARHLPLVAAAAGLLSWHLGIATIAAGLIAWHSALPRLGRDSARVLADVPLLLPAIFWIGP